MTNIIDFYNRSYGIPGFEHHRKPGTRNINMDITNRCTLACVTCERQYRIQLKGKVVGEVLSVSDFEKYIPWFDHFDFCGQVSDPSMHPEFDKILELVAKNDKSADVHNTASQRPERWYRKMFDISSGTRIAWRFGIDGLPKDSHKYRTRQDGQKLFDMMSIAAKYNPKFEIYWKYIVFNYNQYDIEECKQMAKDMGVIFNTVNSRRHPPGLRPEEELTSKLAMDNTYFYPND
jgi:MoaA/NifB/PqqE/SkfB family radical SAM enzyme